MGHVRPAGLRSIPSSGTVPAPPQGYRGHRRTARPAAACPGRPGRLDDATVARIIGVHRTPLTVSCCQDQQADGTPCLGSPRPSAPPSGSMRRRSASCAGSRPGCWPLPGSSSRSPWRSCRQIRLVAQGYGVTYGLIAALAWGISTIAAAWAARRVGTYTALLVSQLVGAGFLGLLAVMMRPSLAGLDGLALPGWLVRACSACWAG